MSSCISDDINLDPNSAYTTTPETLVSYAEKNLSDYMNTPSVNTNNFRLTMQYWQEVTYVNESNYDFAGRLVGDSVWNFNYIRVLNNLDQAKQLINVYVPTAALAANWPTQKKNELAIIDMLQVYVYQNMVDTFGNIPYSQSINLSQYTLPVYDDAATVYTSLISRLNNDISNLTAGASFGTTEYYYQGNVAKWTKFGNSLLLKLGIAIADSNSTLAQATVTSAIAGGVFSLASDSCQLNYLATSPNYNQIYAELGTGRNDFIGCKTLINYMNATPSDLRIGKFYSLAGSVYIGQTPGVPGSFSSFSHAGTFAYTPTTPGTILSNTEVAFYLAEAAARYTPGTAATAYNNAVTASFTQWGLTAANASAYLLVKPYDPLNWKKSIGEQAWVAMYNQANVSWNFYRRLDFPALVAPATAIPNAGAKVPVRLTYPPSEFGTNPSNVAAASSAIGGDLLTTKIFWDKF